jgi:hypothetical protein
VWAQTQYPDVSVRNHLAKQIGVTPKFVQIWSVCFIDGPKKKLTIKTILNVLDGVFAGFRTRGEFSHVVSLESSPKF